MKNEKEWKREFGFKNKIGTLDNKEIIDYLKNNKNLYAVLANGGMGKSYLAKKWSKKLKYKIIKAQLIREEDVKNKVIIDNLDEVSLEKSNEIITWITKKSLSNIIIFVRPERFFLEDLFTEINFEFEDKEKINPRYEIEFDFEMKKNIYKEFEKYFLKKRKSKINEIEFDFLSLLSFKLMSLDVININKYDLMEFTRKYNVNNSSSITISSLENKKIFKRFGDDDEIYFVSKTIPSFFVIAFLKKFAHIKYSYLTKFKNFSSQVSFKETSQMILKMGHEGKKIAWNLIKNNDFFFIFLQTHRKTIDLDQFFEYGAKSSSKKELTEKLAKIQIISCNDKDFKGWIYYALNSKILLKKVNFNEYISLINNGIKNSQKKYLSLLMFLNNFQNQCTNDKKLYKEKIKLIKNDNTKKIIDELKNDNMMKNYYYISTLYAFDLIKLKEISIDKYKQYFWPIERTISFLVTYDYEKAFELIKHFKYEKFIFPNKNINLDKFIKFLINKKKNIDEILKIISMCKFNSKKNDICIRKIGIKNITNHIDNLKDFDWERKKIKISINLYNEIKNPEEIKSIYYQNFIEEIFLIEKIKKNEIKIVKEKEINKNTNVKLSNLKNDILLTFENKDLKYIWKYQSSQSNSFYPKPIRKFKIPKNNKKSNLIAHDFYKKLKKILNPKYDITLLTQLIDFILQIITLLDKNFFDNNQFHPLIMIVSTDIKNEINDRFESLNKDKNYNKWYKKIKINIADEKIIEYLSNYDNLKNIIIQSKGYLISEYMKEVIKKIDKKNVGEIITLLDKKSLKDWKYGFFANYYNKFNEAKEAIKKMKWNPKNFSEYINDENKGKMKAWNLINNNYKNQIKKNILNLFKQEFTIFKKNKGYFYTIKWYDQFFSEHNEFKLIWKTINFLKNNNLIEFYFDQLKSFVNKKISSNENYTKIIVWIFFAWMINMSYYVETKILPKKEVKYMLEEYPKYESYILDIWFRKTGKLFSPKIITNFNISNYYRYLNDDLTIIEFKNLFIEKIIPKIQEIAQKVWKNDKLKFETKMQDKISSKISKDLANEYGILLQPESNTYNVYDNRKRIDFILSKYDKYLFIELKTLKNSGLNLKKLNDQLKNYEDSYNLIKIKLLIILENNNLKNETIEKIKQIAKANDFKTRFVKIT